MAQKCVHKGCGKVFTDPEEDCVYHPGPPEFHEGQKGMYRSYTDVTPALHIRGGHRPSIFAC